MASRTDVVLVPFPYTDLSTTLVRPAVVISTDAFTADTGDLLVAMITRQPHTTHTDYELQDWNAARLLYPSWVRAKVACIETSLVRQTIGQLSSGDMAEVDVRLRLAMRL